MTDRETRLRERIDELRDQRDAALDSLWKARAKRDKYRARVYALEEQLERWKRVALGERFGRASGRRKATQA